MKVNEAVAPAELDCTAEPPLHPQLESLGVHAPLKATVAPVSSTRPELGIVGAGGGGGTTTSGVEGVPPPPLPQETSKAARSRKRIRGM
jgi:hypothetical protein